MADKKSTPMRLRITSCSSVYSGINTRGDDYTIYEVQAAKETGEVVDQKLRSFEELPVGEVLDLTVTPFKSEKHGLSYTLARKNKPAGGSSRKVEELTAFVGAIDERLKLVEGRLMGPPAAPASAAVPQAAPAGQGSGGQSLDERFGDVPPF
jgi:hypothetical protein